MLGFSSSEVCLNSQFRQGVTNTPCLQNSLSGQKMSSGQENTKKTLFHLVSLISTYILFLYWKKTQNHTTQIEGYNYVHKLKKNKIKSTPLTLILSLITKTPSWFFQHRLVLAIFLHKVQLKTNL